MTRCLAATQGSSPTSNKSDMDRESNPTEPAVKLQPHRTQDDLERVVHPQAMQMADDSAVTKAEKIERHGINGGGDAHESPSKKRKVANQNDAAALEPMDVDLRSETDDSNSKRNKRQNEDKNPARSERQKGVAPIKAEYLVHPPGSKGDRGAAVIQDDDAAEGAAHEPSKGSRDQWKKGKKEKSQGMNISRDFGVSRDEVGLCSSRTTSAEYSPEECRFGEKCRFEHDIRKYLKEYKREDLTTFDGVCPIWDAKGVCDRGWTCRFVGSHMKERKTGDGREELVLVQKDASEEAIAGHPDSADGTVNEISAQKKNDLMKRKIPTPKADAFSSWIDINGKELEAHIRRDAKIRRGEADSDSKKETVSELDPETQADAANNGDAEAVSKDNRARYTEAPLLPSEKRRVYFGPETPVLAPLTTQGNLPFRRLCTSLGAQITYSEMAMSLPLIQGQKSEWALMRAHASEALPPAHSPVLPSSTETVQSHGYDNSTDLKFGAQIAANKPWQALKATEILTTLCPSLRVVDLNCGCPIDLVYRQGAGSALLDSQGKLEKILRGMNAVSGSVPITVKIRMGTKDNKPSALKLVDRLVHGSADSIEGGQGPCGVAAITLHGRSRQQRYTKNADWSYIADCAALIADYNKRSDTLTDTIREPDPRHLANHVSSSAHDASAHDKVYFLGNGDCYSHTDYFSHLASTSCHSVMLARGALIKPWLFEEIACGQYLDKSASERLSLVERYAKFGLETWGSDERGVGTTRRFLLEWLSFAYRYVPVGILEHLPPSLQDRPPAWRGRNDLETLLGSDNYKDWIKISEMFLGPAHKDFKFLPKHKSNSYEIEAEG